MGKLNAAKLANFMEIGGEPRGSEPGVCGNSCLALPCLALTPPRPHASHASRASRAAAVYVLLGSCEHALLDSKDFYRPVVTPYELHLALTPGAEWTGEYILDYGRLLPRLEPPPASEGGVGGKGAEGGEGAQGEGGGEEGGSEDDEPQFSLLTGRLISRRRPGAEEGAESGGAASASASGASSESRALVDSQGGTLATRQGEFALARSGAEYLSRRAYRGLDPRLGQHAPATIVEGLNGIASGFDGEGSNQGRFQAAGLLETATGSMSLAEAKEGQP